jgi:hypothetical protein
MHHRLSLCSFYHEINSDGKCTIPETGIGWGSWVEGLDRLQEGSWLPWSVLLVSSWHQGDCDEQIVLPYHIYISISIQRLWAVWTQGACMYNINAGWPVGFYRISTTKKKLRISTKYRPHSIISTKNRPHSIISTKIFTRFATQSYFPGDTCKTRCW